MKVRKRILRVVAVLAIAVAAGQIVERLRPAGPSVVAAAPADPVTLALDNLQGVTPVSATLEAGPPGACDVAMDLRPAPGAMIDLTLATPCYRGDRVVIRYSGLAFTAVTGADGLTRMRLPGLETETLVAAYFQSSQVALARVVLPEAASHPRFAVTMAHPARFTLRAQEGGAVFVGTPGERADPGLRGVQVLGSSTVPDAILAQVYSLPGRDQSGVDLSVELRITPETCGRTLPATSLIARNGMVLRQDHAIAVPLCGTAGDILVLKNLLRDPTLSRPQ
jgi:hypothetical protein